MLKITKQIKAWSGEFGKKYTDRNALTIDELDELYRKNCGVTRTELNNFFVEKLNRNIKILEVGSNIGNQLLLLQKLGFENLYGIEINSYAVEFSKSRTRNINIIQGTVFDIPFKNRYFDLVFTSGLLIHISPSDIHKVLHEIHRCTRKYIWGFEYYADEYREVNYRGQSDLLWKTDFVKLWLERFPNLALVKEERFKYLDNENIDTMFLLRKG